MLSRKTIELAISYIGQMKNGQAQEYNNIKYYGLDSEMVHATHVLHQLEHDIAIAELESALKELEATNEPKPKDD